MESDGAEVAMQLWLVEGETFVASFFYDAEKGACFNASPGFARYVGLSIEAIRADCQKHRLGLSQAPGRQIS